MTALLPATSRASLSSRLSSRLSSHQTARRGLRRLPAMAMASAALLATGCAELPRDMSGSPPTTRLVPNAIPPAPISPEEKKKLDALNQQVLREQDAAIARQQQAEAFARSAAYAYPYTNWNLYYGGWGGGRWGGGVSYGSPGWGWGGYPYWW